MDVVAAAASRSDGADHSSAVHRLNEEPLLRQLHRRFLDEIGPSAGRLIARAWPERWRPTKTLSNWWTCWLKKILKGGARLRRRACEVRLHPWVERSSQVPGVLYLLDV